MVEFDAGFLAVLFHPSPGVPNDPATKKPVDRAKERVDLLIETLSDDGEQVLIPTPALSEVLIALGKDAGSTAIDEIHGESAFRVESFDERAAIELAHMSEVPEGKKKRKNQEGTWAKVKFDRQIVAIAKVNGARAIYSTDKDVRNLAISEGMAVYNLHELPLPPATTPSLFEGVENATEKES